MSTKRFVFTYRSALEKIWEGVVFAINCYSNKLSLTISAPQKLNSYLMLTQSQTLRRLTEEGQPAYSHRVRFLANPDIDGLNQTHQDFSVAKIGQFHVWGLLVLGRLIQLRFKRRFPGRAESVQHPFLDFGGRFPQSMEDRAGDPLDDPGL